MTSRVAALVVNHWKLLLSVVALTFIIRLPFLLSLANAPDRSLSPDSGMYLLLANSLRTEQSFVIGEEVILQRTPGYPLFLAGCHLFSDSILCVTSAQVVLSLSTTLLVTLLALYVAHKANARNPGTAALLAGVLYATDGLSVAFTACILTETLFAFLLISSLTCLTFGASSKQNALPWFLAAGLLVGVNALVRPIGVLLVAVYIPYLLWCRHAYSLRKMLLVVVLSAGMLPCIWIVRNGVLTGAYVLSSIGHINLYYYRAASVMAQRDGRPFDQVQAELRKIGREETALLTPSQRLDYMSENALAVIAEHPQLLLRDWVLGFVRTFQDTGRLTVSHILEDAVPRNYVHSWLRVHLILLYLLISVSVLRRRRSPETWLFVLVVLYFCALGSGPEAYSRFRVPLIPVMCVLASMAWPFDLRYTFSSEGRPDSPRIVEEPAAVSPPPPD